MGVIINCTKCGGTHHGSLTCPFTDEEITRMAIPRVTIMRRPVVMEDEGRHFCIAVNVTREWAEQWIADQKDEYFKPGDYYIVEPPT